MNRDLGVLDAKGVKNFSGLGKDGTAVVETNARLEPNLDAAGVARLNRDVQVGADVVAPVTGLGGF